MGFTKLDEGILKSSIMAESPETFKVWIALLASCVPPGVAKVSATFLSAACYLDIDTVKKSLTILENPDGDSRSLNDEGRRIRRIDGGYEIINYPKYRAFTVMGDPNSKGAIRMRKWRDRHGDERHGDVTETESDAVTSRNVTSASASVSSLNSSLSSLSSLGKGGSKNVIKWNGEKLEGITSHDVSRWSNAYPACFVERQILAMEEWLISNPLKAVKSNMRRFITNWLSKSQERGGDIASNRPGSDRLSGIKEWITEKEMEKK